VREVLERSLAGHYGENKTSLMLKEHYYWPSMDDGGQSMEAYHEPQGNPEGSSSSSKVKERVLTLLDLIVLPRSGDMHEPNFVYLLEGDPD